MLFHISSAFGGQGGFTALLKYILDKMFLLLIKELAVLSSLNKSCALPWALAQSLLLYH